jgi:hypothetical protein
MQLGNPLLALHSALAAAMYQHLPDITYQTRDWEAWKRLTKEQQADAIRNRSEPRKDCVRRPTDRDVEVVLFPQTWGSTALGYGGMGGAAVTPAYTVIVADGDTSCVYFGQGDLAYRVTGHSLTSEGYQNWLNDIRNQRMASCHEAATRYARKKESNTL